MAKVVQLDTFIMTSKKEKRITPKNTYELTLNDVKIQLLNYFPEKLDRSNIHVSPVNLACSHECTLLKLCKIVLDSTASQKPMKIAEFLYEAKVEGLSLANFIDCINKDDLLLAFFSVEAAQMNQIDKLFLINVLKTKFPTEEAALHLMKCFLFIADQKEGFHSAAFESRI
ncbi:MAG: hypothetical protein C0582_00945 [Alphaproteobacteria bacterium]|nr:MAG: hypothetical protein C0582_00945 [Alphaproteobacteria bacterium]